MNKWIWVIVLVVVGIVLGVVSIEYLTTSIGHLPSWVPGSNPGHHGHAYKRGYFVGFLALLSLGGAGYLAFKIRQEGSADGGDTPAA